MDFAPSSQKRAKRRKKNIFWENEQQTWFEISKETMERGIALK